MIPRDRLHWIIPAGIITIVVNVALIVVMSLLVSERGLPEPTEDFGAISLVTIQPPEPEQEEELKEPEPPEPKKQMDFTPDLIQPELIQSGDMGGGVAVDLGDFKKGDVEEDFVFQAFELDEPPRPVAKVPPVYPFTAREQGIEGIVMVKLLVNMDGSVGQVVIMDSRPKGLFEDSVRNSVPGWRFQPGKIEGRAVTAWVVTTVRFELN